MPPASAAADSTSLVEHRSFVLFWFARVAAMVAHQMLAVGVGWQIYALTGSALDLGLVGLAQFIPSFLLMLVAGHVADRFDRRRVLQACVIVEAFAAGGLALGSYQGWITERWIFTLIFIVGAARAFQMPAMAALLPLVVPRHLFPRAIASNSAATQAAVIAGPALGGFVYVAGAGAVYAASAAMFVFCAAWGLMMVVSMGDFYRFHFRSLYAVAQAVAPGALLMLALTFPDRQVQPFNAVLPASIHNRDV